MSYLVLARKYRPQAFEEVVGQEHVTRTLANAFSQGRVHHAFLFCGPRGVGKTTAARILGKALNCASGPTSAPCGTCQACQSITDGTSVDYFEMDGASNRGIDSIRELTDAVRYQPAVLRKKVYVIDEVHMLTTEAFNALLKTLEEPPPHVTFVLATTEPHRLPNTILSRCQRYDFKLVPASRLAEHLSRIFSEESIPVEAGAISLLTRESGGSVRDALSLGDQVISYVGDQEITEAKVAEVLGVADRALTRTLVTALADGDAGTALETAESAIARGVDEVQVARAIVRYLRDLAVLRAAGGTERLVEGSAEERAELAAQAEAVDPGRLRQMFERMIRACEDLGQSQQPRLVLDLALIDVAASEPLVPLGDLVERLGDLERKLGGAGGGRGSPAGGSSRPTGGSRPPRRDSRPERPQRAAPAQASAAQASTGAPHPALPPEGRGNASPSPSPSPAPTSSPTPTPSPTSPLAAWEGVIQALESQKKLTLASLYQQARILHWEDRRIELGFPEGTATSELAIDPEHVEAMQEFLREHLGAPVELQASLKKEAELGAQPEAKSIVQAHEERRRDERERREAEAREHPATGMVLGAFGATIQEIKTDV